MERPRFELDFGLSYRDLYDPASLARLDGTFRGRLREADAALSERFEAYRANPASLHGPAESQLLVEVSRYVGDFVAKLFRVENEVKRLQDAADDERAVMRMKKDLWRKRGAKYVEVVYRDPHLRRALIEHGPEESLDWTPPWTMALVDHLRETRGATIVITGEPEPELLADLDQRRTQRARPRLAVEKLLDAENRRLI